MIASVRDYPKQNKKQGRIKNFSELAINPGRRFILEIAEAGLEGIDTGKAIKECEGVRHVRNTFKQMLLRKRNGSRNTNG